MMIEIDSLNLSSDFSEIETICKKYDAPLTRIISAGFSRKELGLGEMEKAIEYIKIITIFTSGLEPRPNH